MTPAQIDAVTDNAVLQMGLDCVVICDTNRAYALDPDSRAPLERISELPMAAPMLVCLIERITSRCGIDVLLTAERDLLELFGCEQMRSVTRDSVVKAAAS